MSIAKDLSQETVNEIKWIEYDNLQQFSNKMCISIPKHDYICF